MDLDTKEIQIKTKATDANGNALFDWKLDPALKTIDHIKRVPIVNPKKMIEKHKDWTTITTPTTTEIIVHKELPETKNPTLPVGTVTKEIISPSGDVVPTPSPQDKETELTDTEWAQLEEQRDLAYKIVYFFLIMIVATFGLLYVYYKMDQKEQLKEARHQREKGTFFGDIDKTTNFDFLGGNSSPKYEVRSMPSEVNFARDLDNI